ncbi:MAG: tetratricopeptide repeat protein [Deltaproteobacteria bacterium]|nr:MAG: tetratricopeptide repeat protein [Deltaproteobacteria bacterium]
MSLRITTLCVLLACSCAATLPSDREAGYSAAVAASQAGDPILAFRGAHQYLKGATPDDPRYDRALRLMARSAEDLGLTYAASLWYLEIAQARREVTLLPEAIRGLERIVFGGPHDEETLVRGFLATADISELPADAQAFVDYLQGLNSARVGLDEWAEARFDRIPASSPYRARADYVKAVRKVARGDLEGAEADFEALLERKNLPQDLAIDVRRSLARIEFERKDWDKALEHYEAIRAIAPDDPELLLEMAWTAYYSGDSRRALGLLLALDAPVYADLIAPERFLLEALCLRRLCQFGAARQAAVRLRQRHGAAIDAIYSGIPLQQSPELRAAAGLRGATRPLTRFRLKLEDERARVEALAGELGTPLATDLLDLYDRGLAEARRREDRQIAEEVDALANDLLYAEEGVRLILHELGVALLRGRRRPAGVEEAPPPEIPLTGERAFFRFEGEFWTDELDDFVVFAEDRCID